MIRPVSFSADTQAAQTAPSDFKERISRPQTYIKNDASAATDIYEKKQGKGPKLKKILLGAAGLAVIAGAIALGAKKGVFNAKEDGSKVIEGIKKGLKTTGDFINDKAGKVKEKFGEIAEKAKEQKENIQDAAEDGVETVVEDGAKIVEENGVKAAVEDGVAAVKDSAKAAAENLSKVAPEV